MQAMKRDKQDKKRKIQARKTDRQDMKRKRRRILAMKRDKQERKATKGEGSSCYKQGEGL